MGTQQQEAWFKPRPNDGDRRALADWQPLGTVMTCDAANPALEALGLRHRPCDRPRGHPGRCDYEAL